MTLPLTESWSIYLIRTKNNALYCGITNDLERRFKMHQEGKGAKALRGKGPLTLEWFAPASSKSQALKAELLIKKQTKLKKERLVNRELIILFNDDAAPRLQSPDSN